MLQIIEAYKSSKDFKYALTAAEYARSDNTAIRDKYVLRRRTFATKDENGKTRKGVRNEAIVGCRILSNEFKKLTMQQNQYLLGNGVTLKDPQTKQRLGPGFDTMLSRCGQNALVQGVCWGYWNADHLEVIEAARDKMSGFVALVDEQTAQPAVGVQFWQIDGRRPMYVRLFELDGVTMYRLDRDNGLMEEQPKRAYKMTVVHDAAGDIPVADENYARLPIVPLYANEEHQSELTPSLKSKIDAKDIIMSDFGDNLAQANEVYWVLNNFGGTTDDIAQMMEEIQRLKVVANYGDGSTAEPRAFEVPYAARQAALTLLDKEIYKDYMALSSDQLTGGSLTTVAIKAAMTDMDMKANAYEWQCFDFVQSILELAGIQTEQITFKRRSLTNDTETIQNIVAMRSDIDLKTALKLYPNIDDDDIDEIMENKAAEEVSGLPDVDALQRRINAGGGAE